MSLVAHIRHFSMNVGASEGSCPKVFGFQRQSGGIHQPGNWV
jgi:hypothetical protein